MGSRVRHLGNSIVEISNNPYIGGSKRRILKQSRTPILLQIYSTFRSTEVKFSTKLRVIFSFKVNNLNLFYF